MVNEARRFCQAQIGQLSPSDRDRPRPISIHDTGKARSAQKVLIVSAPRTAHTSTHNRRVAARLLLNMLDEDADTRRKAMSELVDRIEGRPVQVQRLSVEATTDPATLLARAQVEARAAVVGYGRPARAALPPPHATTDPPDDGDPHQGR